MSKTIMPDVTAGETVNYEEAINQMFVEMRQSNEKMELDQAEIERLKKQTRETLARLEAM